MKRCGDVTPQMMRRAISVHRQQLLKRERWLNDDELYRVLVCCVVVATEIAGVDQATRRNRGGQLSSEQS